MASSIVLLSSFAHADEICGKVKKISWDLGTDYRVELSDGRSLPNVGLGENAHPYIAASMTTDLTVCFYLDGSGKSYYFSSASK